jgi:polysaccharide pyruvyl transferase WcaK-like protein
MNIGQPARNLRILLIGIGGVYNYGCEAIVRGTETIVHSKWPDARIVYASKRPEDDRKRLEGCNIEIVQRKTQGRYSVKNIICKLISFAGISWCPITDAPKIADGYDVVLSIGGDIYTVGPKGSCQIGFLRFGDECEKRGVPYVLWGASVGPFTQNLKTEKIFANHLKNISLITARESGTVKYLRILGISDNVTPCADPAYVVAPEIVANHTYRNKDLTIGINLSPLSVKYTGCLLENAIRTQANTIEYLIKVLNAHIILIPHVVCCFNKADDDYRYLQNIREAIAPEYKESVTLLNNDIGFIGTKKELIKCDLVIAARMHCAINALSAHVPTILVSYSNKSVGMCQYVYGNSDWIVPIHNFCSNSVVQKVNIMISQLEDICSHLKKRIPEVQQDAYRPLQNLEKLFKV